VQRLGEQDSMRRKFSGIEFDEIGRYYHVPDHLSLPYRCNRITIDFNAIETDRPTLVNYQYILEGYDKQWSPVSKQSSATFGNIQEGSYTFKVKAQGPNGVWCEQVIYSFSVLPPWYRTWWAYVSYILSFVLALRFFVKWRERNLREDNEKLEKTVAERTEELVEKNLIITNLVNEQEKIIELRTEELADTNKKLAHANKKLVELIQYNAHNLREPLARVMGAMEIKDFISNEEFENEIWPLMKKATVDLDNSIREVVAIADETVELYG
jgi:signal transduction histidine kinase